MAQAIARTAAHRLQMSALALSPYRHGGMPSARSFSAGGHHGSTKVNIWEQPTNPGNWKEEQFVFVSLGGWGLLFYLGYKAFAGGKKDVSKEVQTAAVPEKHPEAHK